MRSFRDDDTAVAQVVEAIIALSILILAITWAVSVSQRPLEPAEQDDGLRDLMRQALELADGMDSDSDGTSDLQEWVDECDGELIRMYLEGAIPGARFDIFLVDSTGSAEQIDNDDPDGLEVRVARYLVARDSGGCPGGTPGTPTGVVTVFSLRVTGWYG